MAGVWARGASQKIGTPYLFLRVLKLATSNLVHNLGMGLTCQKTTFWTKIGRGSGQDRASKKNLGPLRIFATVEAIATSNLVYNLGLGLSYQKTTFRTKIGGGLGQESIQKKLGPPIYF